MPRRVKGYWDKRSKRYYARLGEINPETGRRRVMQLKHADGRPIAENDRRGLEAAIGRRLEELDALERLGLGSTVADVCRGYLAWHAAEGSSQRTIDDHHYHLKRWCLLHSAGVRIADRPADTIQPEDVWLLDRAGCGALRQAYASILACWRWAARPVKGRDPVRILATNPLAGLAKPSRGKIRRKLIGWPTVRRIVRVAWGRARTLPVAALGRPDRTRWAERLRVLCLQLIALTGCRPGEAVAMEWSDIDLERGLVVIPSERTKTRKTGRDRRFAVPRRFARVLALVRADARSHPKWVFLPAWRRSPDTSHALAGWWRERLLPALAEASVVVPEGATLYWLRHDYQSAGLQSVDADRLSKLVGNSPKVLLETYAHVEDAATIELASELARARRKPSR